MELLKVLGHNLRTLRKDKKLTQEELASLSGVSAQYIGDIERSQVWPSDEILNKLALALKTAPTELLFDDELMLYRLKKLIRTDKNR